MKYPLDRPARLRNLAVGTGALLAALAASACGGDDPFPFPIDSDASADSGPVGGGLRGGASVRCISGACPFEGEPVAEIDASGDWWMLRYNYRVPGDGGPPPVADVSPVSLEQDGEEFWFYLDRDTFNAFTGTIVDGVYVFEADGFEKEVVFTSGAHGRGAFEEGDEFGFQIALIRDEAAEHTIDGAWRPNGSDELFVFMSEGDTLTMEHAGATYSGRVAAGGALLISDPMPAEGSTAVRLRWRSADAIELVLYEARWPGGVAAEVQATGYVLERPAPIDGPTIEATFEEPSPNDGFVDPDSPVVVRFSEPVDPATVTSQSFVVRPLLPVDGRTYTEGEGLDGTFAIDGAVVEFRPTRGALQEYQTEYEVTLTDAITDMVGTPLAPPTRPLRFRTLYFAPEARYRVIFSDDGRLLAAVPQEDGPPQTQLVDDHLLTIETEWQVIVGAGTVYLLTNHATGEPLYIEGGDGGDPGFLGGGGQFTGQHWNLESRADRSTFAPGESPAEYRLWSDFQGIGRSLGIHSELDGKTYVGIRDNLNVGETWTFTRLDPPLVP